MAAVTAFDFDGEGYVILVVWSQVETIALGRGPGFGQENRNGAHVE
jgi:hypothetical protein